MTNNPFLKKNDYPKWSELKPDSIRQDITLALEESEKKLQRIRDLNKHCGGGY